MLERPRPFERNIVARGLVQLGSGASSRSPPVTVGARSRWVALESECVGREGGAFAQKRPGHASTLRSRAVPARRAPDGISSPTTVGCHSARGMMRQPGRSSSIERCSAGRLTVRIRRADGLFDSAPDTAGKARCRIIRRSLAKFVGHPPHAKALASVPLLGSNSPSQTCCLSVRRRGGCCAARGDARTCSAASRDRACRGRMGAQVAVPLDDDPASRRPLWYSL